MDGNVQAATDMLREAIIAQYLRFDLGAAIHYTAMVGNGFVEGGRPETGLQYCNTALRAALFVKDIGFPFLAYQGKARALIALGRKAEAEDVLNEALQRAREERNYLALTQLLIVAGSSAASADAAKAITYLMEATEVSEEKGFHHVFAWSSFELAKVHRDLGNLDEAELLVSRSVAAMRDLEDRYHLPQHLALLADLETAKGEFERADELYSEATDVINALLVNVNQRQLKGSLIATLSEAYVGHFELAAIKLANPGKAYEVIETARGRSLADTLRGETETLFSATEMSGDAQNEISRIQLALLHETDRNARQSLLDQLFRVEQLLSPVRRTSSPLNPATDRPRPVPLSTLQASLAPDEMLLEYVLGETQSYCLRITRAGVAVVVLPAGRQRIEDLVERYRTAIRLRQPEITDDRVLFSLLLEPVLTQGSKPRMMIVPDGRLHLLPFDALKDTEGKYVLESHVVTYAPSATVLYLVRTSRSSDLATRGFLGIGDVIYSGAGVLRARPNGGIAPKENVVADLFDLDAVTFRDLPGSAEEVISAAHIIEGRNELLVDESATEAAFKALPLADFRIIHLAVHGVANTAFPDRAALVLGSSPDSGEDGLLQVREIRDLSLNADLVTLSACDTGTGRLLGQEGIASLERAFLLAGARAVIASLWPADDTYTIALMMRMYEHLVDGADKAAALRQAKLDLLRKFSDQALPIYWAGFTLVGDGSTAIFNLKTAVSR